MTSRSSTRSKTCRRFEARTITFSAYIDEADFRLSKAAIVYHDEAGAAPGGHETARLAQHREPDGDARRRSGARTCRSSKWCRRLSHYEPQPHRCEFVREVGGVDYINDSKATNLDAVEKALHAQTKPVVLIAGGKDKGFNFEPLRELV